ncbi:MAG: peptidylprolyl isomerase [Myxococcota bacterium]
MALSQPLIWVRNIALILVIVAFVVVFGMPSASGVGGAVAEVDGELIRRDVFEFFRAQLETNLSPNLTASLERDELSRLLDQQTLQTLIQRVILSREARALGLRAPDKELAQLIVSNPAFSGADGRFDPELFERFWRRNGFESERAFTEERRRDILIRKFQRLVTAPVRVSDAHVREAILQDRVKVRLRYAQARAQDFAERVELSPEEIAAFSQPERVRAAYEARSEEFHQPERVRVRHILFEGEDALARAQAARQRLVEGGEDFSALAQELSDDEASAADGGDLGFFPRGRMLRPFEEAAFALEPGQVSEPVETERGIHLIRLEERKPAVDRSLEEAREELIHELLKADRTREEARRAAEALLERLRAGQDFASAAHELGLEPEETSAFGPRSARVPGLGRVPGLKETALGLRPESPVPERVFGDGESFLVIALLSREEPDPAELAAEMGPMRERLEAQERNRVLGRWFQERQGALRQAGKIRQFPLSPAG